MKFSGAISKGDVLAVARVAGIQAAKQTAPRVAPLSAGDAAKNKDLSARRAQVMVKELVTNGVHAEDIDAVGMGSEQPLVKPDNTPAKKAKNRRYEVQVLDSFENPTYPDGQCAALYGQSPPLVNASKKPGEWQSYDIILESPRWDAEGKIAKKAAVTVIHNGVVAHHRKEYQGNTPHQRNGDYSKSHAPEVFIQLQDHNNPMRFRNIWLRKLGDYDQP